MRFKACALGVVSTDQFAGRGKRVSRVASEVFGTLLGPERTRALLVSGDVFARLRVILVVIPQAV